MTTPPRRGRLFAAPGSFGSLRIAAWQGMLLLFLLSAGCSDDGPRKPLKGERVFPRNEYAEIQLPGGAKTTYSNSMLAVGDSDGRVDVEFGQTGPAGPQKGSVRRSDVIPLSEAVPFFTSYTKGNSGDAWGWAALGEAHFHHGDLDEAAAAWTKSVKLNRKAWLYGDLGQLQLLRGKPALALEDFDHALKMEPDDLFAGTGRAAALAALGKHEEAVEFLGPLLERAPQHTTGWIVRARSYSALKQFEKAEANYDGALALAPQHLDALVERGMVRFGRKNLEGAEADFAAATKVMPAYAPALYLRGKVRAELDDDEAALEYLAAAAKAEPGDVGYRAGHAAGLMRLDRYTEALAEADEALKLDGKSVEALMARAYACAGLGREDEALAAADRAVQASDGGGAERLCRANVYMNRREFDQAAADFDAVVAALPDVPYVYIHRGSLRRWRKEEAAALADADAAEKLDPKLHRIWMLRGAVNRGKRNFDQAVSDYDKAIELAPKSSAPYYGKAQVLMLAGRREEAAKVLEAAAPLRDERGYGAWLRALFAASSPNPAPEELSAAQASAETALAGAFGRDWDAFSARAAVHAARGEFDEAVAQQNKALELAPPVDQEEHHRRLKLFEEKKPLRFD